MADAESTRAASVVHLPTAAAAPVVQHRRRGSYGRKIVSFRAAQIRRRLSCEQADEARRTRDEPSFRAVLKVLLSMHLKGEIDDLLIFYKKVGQPHIECVMPGERSRSAWSAEPVDESECEPFTIEDLTEILDEWVRVVSGT